MYKIVLKDELYHHGILGQKWGIRRYQNKDGSLTAAGKKRLRDYSKMSQDKIEQAKNEVIRRGDLKELQMNSVYFTDDEVRATLNRFKLNKDVNSLNPSDSEIALAKAKVFQERMSTVADIADRSAKTWDVFAKISNGLHLTEEPLPTIYEKVDKVKTKIKYEVDEKGNKTKVFESGVDEQGREYEINRKVKEKEKNTGTREYNSKGELIKETYTDSDGRSVTRTYEDSTKNNTTSTFKINYRQDSNGNWIPSSSVQTTGGNTYTYTWANNSGKEKGKGNKDSEKKQSNSLINKMRNRNKNERARNPVSYHFY